MTSEEMAAWEAWGKLSPEERHTARELADDMAWEVKLRFLHDFRISAAKNAEKEAEWQRP